MGRPNYANPLDACCRCGVLLPTPAEGKETTPAPGELGLWQPNGGDPPQWICEACHRGLKEDDRRFK